MKKLKPEMWKPYFWDHVHNKFDGIKFENLAAQLLTLEYPPTEPEEVWHRTEPTWDGKRDFYQTFFDGEDVMLRWVECKAYQKPIEFNVIAPTLIMSTLRDSNEVIVFSYSRLNREAVKGLQEFATVHHKRVRIYDDEQLEQLIFRYRDHPDFDFDAFFPDADQTPLENGHNASPISYSVDAYVYRQNTSYRMKEFAKVKLKVNELFDFRIFLTNQTLDKQQITLECDMGQDATFRFLDAEGRELHIFRELFLSGGEALSVSFPFKITSYARRIDLPRFRLTCKEWSVSFFPGSFLGSWLLETPHLGDMERLNYISEATMCSCETVCFVFGPSGAGKTRYLRELQDHRLMAGRRCLWSDAVHANGNSLTWLKQILSKLYALPLIRVETYESGAFPEVKAKIVTDILYNREFQINASRLDEISSAILDAMRRQDILLIVDNVQDFDNDTLYLLNHLLNLFLGTPGIHMLLSFNTDLLYHQEPAAALLRRLKQLAQNDDSHVFAQEIKGLREGDDELFIRYCFMQHTTTQSDDALAWRPILRWIANEAGQNPLYLEQLLLYLCENSILGVEEEHLYVLDNYSMHECLSALPESTYELLDLRWILLRKNASLPRSALERVLRFICFFDEIPQSFIQEANLDGDAIDLLTKAGFLRQEIGLTFYHPLVKKCFLKKYARLTRTEAKLCYRALKASNLCKEYPGQFYICLMQSWTPSAEQIDQAIEVLTSGKVPTPLIRMYSDTLFAALNGRQSFPAGSPQQLLQFFIAYGTKMKIELPLVECLELFKNIYDRYLTQFSEFRMFGEAYFHFVTEYLNALLTNHCNAAAAALGELLVKELHEFTFQSPQNARRAKASLYNRMHVAYDRLEPPSARGADAPHAHELLLKALTLSYQDQNIDGIIQNEIDYGYIYYLYGGPATLAAEHWRKAFQTWRKHTQQVLLWEGGVYYHKALAHTILHQWTKADQALQQVFRYHERTLHNPYFYVKALTLHSLLLLITKKPFDEVLHAVNEAEDACTSGGFKGVFPVCSHIRALAYDVLSKDRARASDYYEKALAQYIDRCEHPQEEERCLDMLCTLALRLREIRGRVRCAAAGRLQSRRATHDIFRILEADDTSWQEIRKEPVPKGLLFMESTGINYPCL